MCNIRQVVQASEKIFDGYTGKPSAYSQDEENLLVNYGFDTSFIG